MLIDWFTVVAQVVNFVILVWLMKRFLYKPILAAIAAREAPSQDSSRTPRRRKRPLIESATSYSARMRSSIANARRC